MRVLSLACAHRPSYTSLHPHALFSTLVPSCTLATGWGGVEGCVRARLECQASSVQLAALAPSSPRARWAPGPLQRAAGRRAPRPTVHTHFTANLCTTCNLPPHNLRAARLTLAQELLATASYAPTVHTHSTANLCATCNLPSHDFRAAHPTLAQELLATASYAPTVHIHFTATAQPLAILDHEAAATSLAFSPDNNLLAAVLENHHVGVVRPHSVCLDYTWCPC